MRLLLATPGLLVLGCAPARDWYADPSAMNGPQYKGCTALLESDGCPYSQLTYNDEGYLLTEVFGSDGVSSQEYTYDDDGTTVLTSTWTDGADTTTTSYSYDAGRLSHVEHDGDSFTEDYTYGNADQRDTVHTVHPSRGIDDTAHWAWSASEDGGTQAVVTFDVSSQVSTYSWDASRWMLGWRTETSGETSTVTYSYSDDAEGMLESVASTIGTGRATDTYGYDDAGRVATHTQESESGSAAGSFTHVYTWSCD